SGLIVSTPNGLTGNTCTPPGTITANPGATSITVTGVTLAASSTCTFTVNVTGTSAGQKDNCVTPTNCKTLIVLAPPVITKKFAVDQVNLSATTTLTFTINNPNGVTVPPSTLLGVAFTDTLPAGLTVAPPVGTNTCTPPGTVTITAPSTVALAGATLAAGASCTITVTVTGATVGQKNK